MRRTTISIAMIGLLSLAACSKQAPNAEEAAKTEQAGPNIGGTLIPGIALSYSYAFRLPIEQVAATQERHAGQCEALGPDKCRIVGMTYRVSAHRTIEATLNLRLAPELARRFGKEGIAAVTSAGGMLSEAEISSEEAGATVEAADRTTASVEAEQADIANQLEAPGKGSAERRDLQQRAQALRDTKREAVAARAEATRKLASTPVAFAYYSGGVDPGLSDGPLLGAIKDGWANVLGGLTFMLMAAISLSPWIIGLLAIIWLWRRYGARFGLRDTD